MQEFYAHYQVPSHLVDLETFVAAARSIEQIGNAVLRETVGLGAELAIFVDAPLPGSHLQKLWIAVKIVSTVCVTSTATLASIATVMDSKAMNEISERVFGDKLVDLFLDFLDRPNEEREKEETINLVDDEVAAIKCCADLETIISAVSREVLSRSREKISLKNNSDLEFILQEAQSGFYQAAISNVELKAIGFTPEESFPVSRSQFLERAIPPKKLPEKSKETVWSIQISNVVVWSPNFQESDQNARRWKGIVSLGGVRHFTIEDKSFWNSLRSHKVVFDDATELTAQWAVGFELGKEVERKALRILKVNGVDFGEPLTEQEALDFLELDQRSNANQMNFGLFEA